MENDPWFNLLMQDVHKKWDSIKSQSPIFNAGYSVFYSPPNKTSKLMIIGFNPGGSEEDFNGKIAMQIPEAHDYFSEDDYPLAKKMRTLFESINMIDTLKSSVKLNLLFFRTKDIDSWNNLPLQLRQDLEKFCHDKVLEIIKQLAPKVILAEGVETYRRLKLLAADAPEIHLSGSKNRVIYARSSIIHPTSSTTLIGITHPTGSRPSHEEWGAIAKELKSDLKCLQEVQPTSL